MRKLNLLILAALASLWSCQQLEISLPEEELQTGAREMVITASMDADMVLTRTETERTVVDGSTSFPTYWSPDDRIMIYSAGESSEFVAQNVTERTRVAQFKGTVSAVTAADGLETSYVWGVYPSRGFDLEYTEPEGNSETAVINATFPSLQVGKAGSYATSTALMVGRSESTGVSFKNVYTSLSFTFASSDIVSVTLRGLDGEVLAGRVSISLVDGVPTSVPVPGGEVEEVTLYAPSGGCFASGPEYFMLFLPKTFESGYTLTLRRKDGQEGTYIRRASSGSPIEHKRNGFVRMQNIDSRIGNPSYESVAWHAGMTQGLNEIWYTVTPGSGAVSYDVDGETGNEVDTANCVAPDANGLGGIIRFKAPLTTIDMKAFMGNAYLKTVSLPNTVEHIDLNAFCDCENLEGVSFGSNLKTIGAAAFDNCGFREIILPEGLTALGQYAFGHCRYLESVTLPESLRYPGIATFMACPNLRVFNGAYASDDHRCLISDANPDNVTLYAFAPAGLGADDTYVIPDGVHTIYLYAFSSSKFGGVVLPESLALIGPEAFSYCQFLKNVTIPSNVISIQGKAFYGCNNLEWIKIENESDVITPTSWTSGNEAFNATNDCDIYVPSNLFKYYKYGMYWDVYESRYRVISKPDEIFYSTVSNEDITLSSSLQTLVKSKSYSGGYGVLKLSGAINNIPQYAFYQSVNLKTIVLPETVQTINQGAFTDCSNLEEVTFGSNLKEIQANAFFNCNLASVTLPEGLQKLGVSAFSKNPMTSVRIPAGINFTQSQQNPFTSCPNLRVFTGENSHISDEGRCILSADGKTFIAYASGATSGTYEIPEGVTTIGAFAMTGAIFSGIKLPESVTSISSYALSGCANLTYVSIPKNVTDIGYSSFNGCPALSTVHMESVTPPSLGPTPFGSETSGLCVEIPGAGVSVYKGNSSWSNYNFKAYQADNEIWFHRADNTAEEFTVGDITGDAVAIAGVSTFSVNDVSNGTDPVVGAPYLSQLPTNVNIIVKVFDSPLMTYGHSIPNEAADVCDYVSLPGSLTEIGQGAFYGCWNLNTVFLKDPSNLTVVGPSSFSECYNITTIGQDYGKINLPSVTSIGESAFAYVTMIEEVNLPELTTAAKSSFSNLGTETTLTSVNVPKLRECPTSLFAEVTTLDYLDLPSVTSVSYGAFESSKIGTVVFGPNLSILEEYAFLSAQETTRHLYFQSATPPTPYDGDNYVPNVGLWKGSLCIDYAPSQILPLNSIHVPQGSKAAYIQALHQVNSAYSAYDSIIYEDL